MSNPNPTPAAPRKRRTGLIIALVVIAVAVVAAVWTVALPNAADRIDSGVQACKFISEGKGADGQPTASPGSAEDKSDETFTADQYKELREVFTDSRHDDISTAGAKFVDDAYNMNLFGVMSSYGALNGACTSHGHPLPPLTAGQ